MLNAKILVITACVLLCCSCNKKQSVTEVIPEIDMAEYETIRFNSLVKDITCIKLDSKDAPVFGYKQMTKYKNFIYLSVMSPSGEDVFIYDESGNFIKRLVFKDTLILSTMIVNPVDEQLWVIAGTKVLRRFELDGTFISETVLPFHCTGLIAVNDREFLVYNGGYKADYSFYITDMSTERKRFLHNKTSYVDIPHSLYALDTNTNNIYITLGENDTIYRFQPDTETLDPFLHLNFHGDFLTKDKIPKGGFSDKQMAEFTKEDKYVFSINSFKWASDRLFFKLSGKRDDFCTINMHDYSLQSFDTLFDDFQSPGYNSFFWSDGERLYCIVKEKELVAHYQQKECSFSGIQQILPSLQENGDSWILLAIEIK